MTQGLALATAYAGTDVAGGYHEDPLRHRKLRLVFAGVVALHLWAASSLLGSRYVIGN